MNPDDKSLLFFLLADGGLAFRIQCCVPDSKQSTERGKTRVEHWAEIVKKHVDKTMSRCDRAMNILGQ